MKFLACHTSTEAFNLGKLSNDLQEHKNDRAVKTICWADQCLLTLFFFLAASIFKTRTQFKTSYWVIYWHILCRRIKHELLITTDLISGIILHKSDSAPSARWCDTGALLSSQTNHRYNQLELIKKNSPLDGQDLLQMQKIQTADWICRIMLATFFSLVYAWIILCIWHAPPSHLGVGWKKDLGLYGPNLLRICHMEAMSIHYPSKCQTPCKGAAVHRRPANWFDTGEKWCMIALVNLSLPDCQMALA